ncbi:MAG: hypothetical protein JWM31_3117, partial [Solirubrobacterales bacterium]|nr:hypothetical protein [Solirubrobacterales bacterium]
MGNRYTSPMLSFSPAQGRRCAVLLALLAGPAAAAAPVSAATTRPPRLTAFPSCRALLDFAHRGALRTGG